MTTLSLDKIERFYRFHSAVYDFTRWMILFSRGEAARSLVSKPEGDYLEVGCGTGLNFPKVLAHVGPHGSLTGLDYSPEMLACARKRVERGGMDRVSLVRANAEDFDLGRSFDGILFAYSITMIPDWKAAVACCLRHLKPGGRMVVLDFYTLDGWPPPMPRLFSLWLGLNHVATARDYPEHLSNQLAGFDLRVRNRGWNFIATGNKPEESTS